MFEAWMYKPTNSLIMRGSLWIHKTLEDDEPVVVLTKEEVEDIKNLLNSSIKNPEECSSWLEEALGILEKGGNDG